MSDTIETDGRREIYEKLEHGLSLANLINPDSLRNLLQRFSEYLRIGLVATDGEGAVLGSGGDVLRPCRLDPSRTPCAACAGPLPVFEGDDKFVVAVCATGVRFLRARIDNMFEPIGYLVVGPVATVALSAEGDVRKALEGVREMTPEEAHEAALLLATVVEEVVFANYQSYLFSKMHLQLSRENMSQVTEGEQAPSEDGYLDSGQFSSLF